MGMSAIRRHKDREKTTLADVAPKGKKEKKEKKEKKTK